MTKLYIIGSNRFELTKKYVFDQFKYRNDFSVKAVGLSDEFQTALMQNNIELLHAIEDRVILDSDIIVLIDSDKIRYATETYVGPDTLRELNYAKSLNKKIFSADQALRLLKTIERYNNG